MEDTVTAFKHAKVRQFKIGKFVFKDHILKVTGAEDLNEFLKLAGDLPVRDRMHITEIKNLENERPLDLAKAVRGTTLTTDVRDAKDRSGAVLGRDNVLRANPKESVGGSAGAIFGNGDVGDENGVVNLEQANALVDNAGDPHVAADDGNTFDPAQNPTDDPANAGKQLEGTVQENGGAQIQNDPKPNEQLAQPAQTQTKAPAFGFGRQG